MDYLKLGSPDELSGKERKLYRYLEITPAVLSWGTLVLLIVFSYFQPVYVAFFIIAFDVYWLLLVLYLGIHLAVSFGKMKKNTKTDWREKCQQLGTVKLKTTPEKNISWNDLVHMVLFPVNNEAMEIIRPSFEKIANGNYPCENMIMVFAVEERGGEEVWKNANKIKEEFGSKFKEFILVRHPDGMVGEIKGKGANQAFAAEKIRNDKILEKLGVDEDLILISVFDIDTIIYPDYFYCLSYLFLTVDDPYRASYQPIPVYHNNVWQAPFFARVAASSNTFWQMMQQIRQEKLATYSSHSMTWRALKDVGFWSKSMVSEDSRIFWHCFCYYNGDYRVVPMYYPVSMDVTQDKSFVKTAKSLYIQQRRWGWGVENLPYLCFNAIKRWKQIEKSKFLSRIFVQFYGFHSWATNALIIGVIGWMPMLIGGDKFNSSVLSTNLPFVTRTLMMLAMSGLVFSAILSTILLPNKPKNYPIYKYPVMLLQWLILPISIIVFGAIPGLDAQTRLALNKPLGFKVTPKTR